MSFRDLLTIALVAIVVLVAWELVPPFFKIPRYIIPTASQTWAELMKMVQVDNLSRHFISTSIMTTIGFLVGSFLGAAGGYLLGMSRFWERVLSPYILGLQIAPKVAFAPLFIMWFGIGIESKLAMAAVIVFFLVFLNTYSGVQDVNPIHIHGTCIMGA